MKFRIYIDVCEEECIAALKDAGYEIESVYIKSEEDPININGEFANLITINSLDDLKNIEKILHYQIYPCPVNDISLEFTEYGDFYKYPKMFICND